MNYKTSLLSTLCLLAMMVVPSYAQDVYGYVYLPVPAQSDVLVSVPLNNADQGDFTIAAGGISGNVITVEEAIGQTFDADKYYVRFIDGAAAGLWTTISANGANTFTLDNTEAAALAAAGDTVRVFKHHTIGSIFPAGLLGVTFVNQTQLLFFSDSIAKNKAPGSGGTVTYTTLFNTGWGADVDRVIKPEEAFVVRNNSASDLVFVKTGLLPQHKVAFVAPASSSNDIVRGIGYPVSVTVEDSDWGDVNQRQILLVNNAAAGKNKAPGSGGSFTYTTLFNTGWGADATTSLSPSAGYIFRQNSGVGGKVTPVKPY
ncbi:TIGR02597 family protein [Planctomycetales bacterium ZRK34]|nr:TIGR02597 family protein [Planctomycetales bacterium ZRK34]